MSGRPPRSERPRDMLLTFGVAIVAVGLASVVAAFVRWEPVDAGLSALVAAGGVALWRWRRSKLG